jgi:SAM-dependent methyltransferase
MWDGSYAWDEHGDEWSKWWGSAEAQWRWTLLPRIGRYVPAPTILEIAPGYGRWTNYLKDLAKKLIIVDLSKSCIDHCRERFAADKHIESHVNDGTSLDMVPDGSLDFVFSFDSLVHAEANVLESYLAELSKKLKPNGVGFIHHSNIQPHLGHFEARDKIKRGRGVLERIGLFEVSDHWRARSMSAAKFEQYATNAGLQCIGQELVNWGSRRTIDSFSTFTPAGSQWARPNVVVENPGLMREAESARWLSSLYTAA